jgi:ribosomal protein L40E
MQQTTICTSCGTEIASEARFCRRCGQASAQFKTESVTEGTTRLLETPEPNKPFGQEFYEQHGNLAQQTIPLPPQANQTARSLTAETNPRNWLLFSTILFACVALIAIVLLFTMRNRSAPASFPPVGTKPNIPPVHPPPQPPLPPQTGGQGNSTISHDLVYPGAETIMETSSEDGGSALQLRTTDSIDKVADWYMAKLKPTNIVKENKGGARVILVTDQMQAVITAQGSETLIILHQGND